MGRTGRKGKTAGPAVVGPTPLSDRAPFTGLRQQRRAGHGEDDLDRDRGAGAAGSKEPSKVSIGRFFDAPPRTELMDGPDTFKQRSAADGAPVGLGELSATIWSKTAASKGGAKDPAAAPSARLASIMTEMAELDEGGGRAALMSSDGFRAYAEGAIWGVRAAGEAEDAPLDEGDRLQVRARLRLLWRTWRKLPADVHRQWADKQLGKEAAATLARVTGGAKAAAPKGRRAARSVTTAEPLPAVARDGGRPRRKPDGWSYVPPPRQLPAKGSKAAAELRQLRRLERDQEQRGSGGGEGEGEEEYGKGEVADAEFARAEALRFSRGALLAEMRSWEEEDDEEEAAAAAGVTVEELRKQRKEEDEAKKAVAKEARELAADKQEEQEEGEQEEEQEGAGGDRRQRSRSGKRGRAVAGKAAAKQDRQGEGLPTKRAKTAAGGSKRAAKEAASAGAKPGRKDGGGAESSKQAEAVRKKRRAADGAAAEPALAPPQVPLLLSAADVAAAALTGPPAKQPRSSKQAAGKPSQQQSPQRRSARQQLQQQQQQQDEDDEGPSVSGAGRTPPSARRTRCAGPAKQAQQEALEMDLFSNTRRKSLGRADSPGAAPPSKPAKRSSSRLGKSKGKARAKGGAQGGEAQD